RSSFSSKSKWWRVPNFFLTTALFHSSPAGFTEGAGVLPDGLNAAVGETVMFTTTLSPTEKPFQSVNWVFNLTTAIIFVINSEITIGPEYEGRVTFFPSTASLELRSLTLDDTGEYGVSIIQDGKILNLVEFSGSVSLSCSASGSSLSFLWLNGSSEVTASDRVHLTDGGSSLTVINVTRSDQGPFSCRVSSPVSTGTSGPVNLSISCDPDAFFPNSLDYDDLDDGEPSQTLYPYIFHVVNINFLYSLFGSRPPAQFKWFLNGDQLPDTGSELRLMNVQMSQSGNYSCQAFNNRTLRSQTSQPSAITVLGKCNFMLKMYNSTIRF
uniref:Ig-like domain-containing protein n=1 Tax=Oreochromis niloticus TaxID=8128 RepID=A0A669CX44_ORENI